MANDFFAIASAFTKSSIGYFRELMIIEQFVRRVIPGYRDRAIQIATYNQHIKYDYFNAILQARKQQESDTVGDTKDVQR